MRFISLVLSILVLSAAPAMAETPAPCEKRGNLVCQAKSSKAEALSFTSVQGDVSVLRDAKLLDLKKTTAARPGDRILVGRGSANVALSATCSANIPSDATARIIASDTQTCVEVKPELVTGSTTPQTDQNTVAAGLVATADAALLLKILSDANKSNTQGGLSP